MYVDESGNTGKNLADSEQPIHWMAAVLVPEDHILSLSQEVDEILLPLEQRLGHSLEIHGQPMYGGRGSWKTTPPAERLSIFAHCLELLSEHGCVIMYSSINKTLLGHSTQAGQRNDPHFLAFQFLVEMAEKWLAGQAEPMQQRALITADETDEHEAYCIEMMRSMQHEGEGLISSIPVTHIVDTVHYVKSQNSRGVQLADLVAYTLNRCDRGGNPSAMEAMWNIRNSYIDPLVRTWRATWPIQRENVKR